MIKKYLYKTEDWLICLPIPGRNSQTYLDFYMHDDGLTNIRYDSPLINFRLYIVNIYNFIL